METQILSNEELNVIAMKYNKLYQSRKKAVQKYHSTHKEKLNEIARNFYARHKDDETFREHQRELWRKAKLKQKEAKQTRLLLTS